tara:strand:+ start:324 stop:1034 length:711 start_codon:yes stop_codon:yes gene_type:complete
LKKIVLLSSDTIHHRYFINKLIHDGIKFNLIIFENTHVEPLFDTGPLYEEQENSFEETNFFGEIKSDLNNLDIFEIDNVNTLRIEEMIKKIKPDFGIVFGTRKIKNSILKLFSDGLLNVHRGIAQRYRGLDSDLWAIYHNDYNNIGVTIHMVESKLDTGNIIYQKKMEIKKNMKTFQIRYFTTLISTDLVFKSIQDYLCGKLRTYNQKKLGRYYSFMPIELKKIVNKKFNKHCKLL